MAEIATRSIRCAGALPAFLALPAAAGRTPAVVLMHERYGLVRHTRDLAERWARDGFVCIAPDFFHKHPDQDALHRGDTGYEMTDPEAVEYLNAAITELATLSQVDPAQDRGHGRVPDRTPGGGAGGAPRLAAAWFFTARHAGKEWTTDEYRPVMIESLLQKLSCPVLGVFGAADHIISIDDVLRFRAALEQGKKTYHVQSTAMRRTAGSTTRCRAVTAAPRRRRAGRCSSNFSRRRSSPATTAHDGANLRVRPRRRL